MKFEALTASSILVLMFSGSIAYAGGVTRQIPSAGTTAPRTGAFTPSGARDVTKVEFPFQPDDDSGPAPYPGTITNRSLSKAHHGMSVSATSVSRSKSQPHCE